MGSRAAIMPKNHSNANLIGLEACDKKLMSGITEKTAFKTMATGTAINN